MPEPDIAGLEHILGYRFHTRHWAVQALTHSSLINEPAGAGRQSNVQLEFVGDAVIELAVRVRLASSLPGARTGLLTKEKQKVVTDRALADLARRLGLAKLLQRGAGQPESADNDTILAQVLEAAIGAVFRDAGYEAAQKVLEPHLATLSSPSDQDAQ
jgi:ribonuclease III